MIIGEDQEPPTLNQFAPGGDNFIVAKIAQGWNCGVQDVDGFTLEMIPDLVTELPTVANGGLTVNADGTETVRYQIREEAVWEDGTAISGEDFAFTLETIMNPDYPIAKGTYEDIIAESVVVGPKTFEFSLAQPTVQAELIFGLILPKHQIEGTDFIGDYNDTGWLSCGPFKIDQWQRGEFVKLVRNENFWKTDPETGQQLPYLDAVVFRFIPETASLVNAFKAREVDVINPPPSIAAIEDLQPLEAEGASVEVLSGQLWEHLNFQFGENRLGRNPESMNEFLLFRRAVAFAIDKQKIVDEILQRARSSRCRPTWTPTTRACPRALGSRYAARPGAILRPDRAVVRRAGLRRRRPRPTPCSPRPRTTTPACSCRSCSWACSTRPASPTKRSWRTPPSSSGETQDFGRWDLGSGPGWEPRASPGWCPGTTSRIPALPPPDGQNYYRWGTLEVDRADHRGVQPGALVGDRREHGALCRVAGADERHRRRGAAGRPTSPRRRRSWPTRWSSPPSTSAPTRARCGPTRSAGASTTRRAPATPGTSDRGTARTC